MTDDCLHCDNWAPEEGAFIPLVGDATSRVHTVQDKRLYFLPGCIRMSEAHIHVDDNRPPVDHYDMAGRGLYTDFLWKLVLPLDGLTAPRALGDVGLCG